MWVIKRTKDGQFVAKPEITQITGASYTGVLKNARKYDTREAAVADSCVENEIAIRIDPYEYFK